MADGEAKARAAVPGLFGADLDIGVADMLLVLFGNAAACVLDLKSEEAGLGVLRALVGNAQLHIAGRGELDGVADEVEDDLPEALRVEHERWHRLGAAPQFKPGRTAGSAEGVHQTAHEAGAVRWLGGDLHLAGFEFGKVEDVVDEPEEASPAHENRIKRLRAFLFRLEALLEHFGEPDDGVERGADVMADGGEEIALGLRLLSFQFALAVAEDFVENEHEGEREDGEAGLDEIVAHDRVVHESLSIMYFLAPGPSVPGVGRLRGVGFGILLDKVVKGPRRCVIGCLPDPNEG